ncbi:hypothetical protein ANCCAN_08212 [Ancylostoma caninum]|uniref:MULE transposase domain-containing protein n=1 Tax=Ancylostoma caninum TaxID=29170 RepID=A0A368GN20_ANCCA|nr:hypothetical protein ANCCAN_08212 [Ancylostoma caninum]
MQNSELQAELYASDASPLAQESAAFSHDEVVLAASREPVFIALKKVSGGEFLSDPSELPHQCTPKTISRDIAVRKTYEDLQHIWADKRCVGQAPKGFWHDTLDWIDKNVTEENGLKGKVKAEFYGPGYSQRRDAYSRAVNSHVERDVSLEHIQLPGLHIFYSIETIQEACRQGLYALVADGTFGMHPVEAGKKAQLYCIHGVCSSGVEVPLLYSVTDRRTIAIYKKIFGHIKKHLTLPRSRTLRVILDFEEASIRAARMKAAPFTYHKHGTGEEMIWDLSNTFMETKGKKDLFGEVKALRDPPVPEGHGAHAKCVEFLDYLKTTWMEGLELGTLIKVRHPSLATLLHHSHKINLEAVCALKRIEHAPGEQRTLRRKDQARKDKINEAMQKMQQERERGLSTIEVVQYCRKISTYLTEKSV